MSKDIRVQFPVGGIHEGAPFTEQPPLTTSDALNVTGQDPVSGRTRGAQRSGMSKFTPSTVGSNGVAMISSMSYDDSAASISAYASGSEVTQWSKIMPSKGSAWCIAVDSSNNVYAVDSGATIVKYNPTGYQLYTHKVPVKDEGHEVRSIAIDPAGIIYVGVSSGGDQKTAHVFAFDEIEGVSGQYLEKVWEYKTERYVAKLVYATGKLYAALNDTQASKSSIAVLSNVGTAVPQLEREVTATYPVNDIEVSPKDGGLISTSPSNTLRGGDRIYGTSFKSPATVDWDPKKLEGFDKRVWAWLDATDIDGDGSGNEAYSDGEEIQLWTDKSGNGRDLFINPNAATFGPLLSKGGMSGLDCLSFASKSSSGADITSQYLVSGGNTSTLGDSAINANNPENLSLIPSHIGASYAVFIVCEAIDDGTNPQHILSQRYSGFYDLNETLSFCKGVVTIAAHHCSTLGTIESAGGPTGTIATAYAPGNCSLIGFGDNGGNGSPIPSRQFALGQTVSSIAAEQMHANVNSASVSTTRLNVAHSGTSRSNRFIVSYVCRNKVSGAVPQEPIGSGESAVQSPGYATTDASHFRVNGRLCQTFVSGHLYSDEFVRIGSLSPTIDSVGTYANSSFKGKICEILVLKEWYYRPDETLAQVRLNVCSSRPPAYTVADHGEYSGVNYFQPAGDGTGAGLAGDAEDSRRIYETELIEGYLAHKWGMADELPDSLVTYLVVNNDTVIPNSHAFTLPNPGGAASVYQFYSSSTASLGVGVRGGVYIEPGAPSLTQMKAQAYEIYRAINGNGNFANSPNEYVYAKPPTFSGLQSNVNSDRFAIIEIRSRSSMAHAVDTSGFGHTLAVTGFPRLRFVGIESTATGGGSLNRMSPRTKTEPVGVAAVGWGINYSIHPFCEHRRNIHKNAGVIGGWTAAEYKTARTLGGPPRSDLKRKYQPLQIFSSASQNIVKYDKDSGLAKWSLYNASPEGVQSGGNYVGFGGIGYSVACNKDGVVFSSGQRSQSGTYPNYTEHSRLGLNYTSNTNDVRATIDNGSSASLSWQAQITPASGLDALPGWARACVDEKGNFVVPILEQEATSAAVAVYSPSGTQLHKHTLYSLQVGLSTAASAGTILLPDAFVNKRSEYIYLGTRCDNSAVVSFSANPTNGQTVTFSDDSDVRSYTFTSGIPSGNQVAIGATLADTVLNLRNTINGLPGGTAPVNTSVVVRGYTASNLYVAAKNPEPSGGTGVFTFAATAPASMGPVAFQDAAIRRINLLKSEAVTSTSSSFRKNKNIAVDGNGGIRSFTGSTSTAATGTAFTATDSVFYDSAVLYQKLYITNGLQVLVYDPTTNSTSALESKSSGSPTERWSLITSWRGRLVLGRGLAQPHNWIMSAIGDPTNWDLFPPVVNPGQAVSGTISRAGLVPDVVNAMIPYNDDLMLFGGDHSIYRLTGDPMSGGQMDLVTDVTGIAFGHAWDKDPQGVLYFVSSRGSLYAWPPGGRIIELSLGKFEQRLASIDFSNSYVRVVWNDMDRALHIFSLTRAGSGPGAVQRHFRYERDSKAFWEDSYGVTVSSAFVSDGDTQNDRNLLIGTAEGYIMKWDPLATSDDGDAIDSYVTFGPFGSQDTELRLSMLQAVLADNQSGAHVQLFASDTPDVLGDPVWAGKLTSGRNPNMFTRVRGSYFWIRLRNSAAGERWAFENMTVRVAQAGRRRVR